MVWFPVDDAFHSHPKARKAGDEALGMWARAGSYCMAYLTDGFVPDWWIKEQPNGPAKAERLVDARLWRRAKRGGEQGCQFHDWKPWCTKEHVESARENARQRKAKSRSESRSESRVTGRVTDAVSPWPIQSNPIHIPLVTSRRGVTESNARESEPPSKCSKHINHTDPPPCGACADARRRHEAWQAAQQENQLAERRRIRAERNACPYCDDNGMRETPTGLLRCDHPKAGYA